MGCTPKLDAVQGENTMTEYFATAVLLLAIIAGWFIVPSLLVAFGGWCFAKAAEMSWPALRVAYVRRPGLMAVAVAWG